MIVDLLALTLRRTSLADFTNSVCVQFSLGRISVPYAGTAYSCGLVEMPAKSFVWFLQTLRAFFQ